MVEQVRVNPEEVRGYGNICEGHTLEDFIVSDSGLAKEKENVHGALTDVYKLVYSLYGLMFDFDKGNKQLYLQMAEANILSFGFDTVNKQLYLVDENDTGFNLGFDEDTNELYITDEAPPIISISASNPYLLSGEKTDLIVTLHNGVGTPLANKSVTVSDGTSVYNGITNNDGMFTVFDVTVTEDTTFTATYSSVSDSVVVEYCAFVDYAVTSNHNDSWDGLTYMSRGTDGTTINNTGSGTLFERIKINNSTAPFSNGDFTVTLNILSVTGSDNRLRVMGATTCSGEPYPQVDYTLLLTSIGEFKMVYDSTNHTVKTYKDGTLIQTTNRALCGNLTLNIRITTGSSIKYKDLRVKSL